MLLFDRRLRRCTPGPFRTRVLTEGVDPTLTCYYKSSRLKQYFKEGRALRTETVICDTRDFGIGRQVCAKNWYALRAVGESANRRLCDAETADALPAPDGVTFHQVTQPSKPNDGLYSPGLRFGDPRVMAILASLVGFCHLVQGFTNRQLVAQTAVLHSAQADSAFAFFLETAVEVSRPVSARAGSGRRGSLAESRLGFQRSELAEHKEVER
jgi:hypothetical protein